MTENIPEEECLTVAPEHLDPYLCTRDPHTDGDHVATIPPGDVEVARWSFDQGIPVATYEEAWAIATRRLGGGRVR